jgi:hypothetical protein
LPALMQASTVNIHMRIHDQFVDDPFHVNRRPAVRGIAELYHEISVVTLYPSRTADCRKEWNKIKLFCFIWPHSSDQNPGTRTSSNEPMRVGLIIYLMKEAEPVSESLYFFN